MVNDFILSITTFIKGIDWLSLYIGVVFTTFSMGCLNKGTRNKSKLFILGASLLTPISILVLILRPSWRDGGKDGGKDE